MKRCFASTVRVAAPAVLALAMLVSGGCGGGGSSNSGAALPASLPSGAAAPKAYAETHFARNLGAAARPEHLVVVQLESSGSEPGDTGESGTDRIPYAFESPARLILSIHDSAIHLGRLTLASSSGEIAAKHERGDVPSEVTVPAGTYTLELQHARRGDASAPKQVLFVRNVAAPGAAEVQLSVAADCVGCDFSAGDLSGQNFDDKDLTGAKFRGAMVTRASFRGAKLRGADFASMTRVIAYGYLCITGFTCMDDADFSRSPGTGHATDLTGAIMDGAWGPSTNFRQAILNNTSWLPRITLDTELPPTTYYAQFPGADFTDAKLVGANLTKVNLGGASFRGADLSGATLVMPHSDRDISDTNGLAWGLAGADFSRSPSSGKAATLIGAHLENAVLQGADFTGADLSRAYLSGTVLDGANLASSNFSGVDLSHQDLSRAILSPATRLEAAILSDGIGRGVDLSGQNIFPPLFEGFKGKDLRFVKLNGLSLYQVNLEGANLSSAQLIGTNLSYANLKGAKLTGAFLGVAPGGSAAVTRLQGAYMPDADLTDADLRSADLSGVHLYSTTGSPLRLTRARLDSAVFASAILAGTAFNGSLNDASFNNALLVAADFSGANLTNTKFDSAYLQGASFMSAASVIGLSLNNAAVATTSGAWTYTEQDGTPSTYSYGATQLGSIATSSAVTCPNSASGPCTSDKLAPVKAGPFPPVPACIPAPPDYDNCDPPRPL